MALKIHVGTGTEMCTFTVDRALTRHHSAIIDKPLSNAQAQPSYEPLQLPHESRESFTFYLEFLHKGKLTLGHLKIEDQRTVIEKVYHLTLKYQDQESGKVMLDILAAFQEEHGVFKEGDCIVGAKTTGSPIMSYSVGKNGKFHFWYARS